MPSGPAPTTLLTVPGPRGPLELTCFDNWLSRWASEAILRGQTYPAMPFVKDVRVVVDAGANVGAAASYFAAHYPDAEVHALEPGAEAYELLRVNARRHANLSAHNVGLHAEDQRVPLFRGAVSTSTSSTLRGANTTDDAELVTLRAADRWLRAHAIRAIDVLKVDVEGCELPVFRSLADWLPSIKVVYLEYHSADARRELDALLSHTHELALGHLFLAQGEVAYISHELAAQPDLVMEALTSSLRPPAGLGARRSAGHR